MRAVRVCGTRTPIRSGDEKNHPDLKGAYACYDLDTTTIWLDKNIPQREKLFWLTHETLHALMNKSGAFYVTAAALGLKREDPRIDAWEEAIIRVLTPHIIETFGGPK